MHLLRTLCLFITLFILSNGNAAIQKIPGQTNLTNSLYATTQTSTKAPEVVKEVIIDEYNRGTPRSTIDKFLESIRKKDYQHAIHYLDFSGTNKAIRAIPKPEVAKRLQLVLDRSLWVDLPTLSDEPSGFVDDGIAGNRDLVGYVDIPNRKVPIYVQRVERDDGVQIWKIAGISINELPELYEQYSDGPIGEILTKFVPDVSIAGLKIWQWITLALMTIVAFIVAWIPTQLFASYLRKSNYTMKDQLASIISGPIFILIMILLLRWWCMFLKLSIDARQVTQGYPVLIIVITWVLLMSTGIIRDHLSSRLAQDNKKTAAKLLRPLTTMIRIVIVVTATLVWLENLGFKATTILAGLGIGGLAFALAAQKTIENIIAGITLYAASPVKVGNLCRFGKHIGFIEEVGMRYTRIRTLDRTVINISNSVFVDMELENYSERNRIRFKPRMVLSHSSSPDQIEKVIKGIKQLLDDHEKIAEKPCRVRLSNYLEYGIELNVMSYVETTSFPVYAEVSNELNLKILNLLAKNKVKLADLSRVGMLNEKQPSLLKSVIGSR